MTAEQIVAWLSECSDWMLANDLDMQCPMETDPVDVADAVTALQATVERQAAEIRALRAMLEQAEDDLERARTVIGRVRATVGEHNG